MFHRFCTFSLKKSCLNKKVSWFFFPLNNSLTLENPHSPEHQAIKNQLQAWSSTPSLTPTETKHKNEPPKKSGREFERHWLSQHITSGLSYKFPQPFFTLQLQQEFEVTESSQTLLLCRNRKGLLKLSPPYNENITNHGILSAESKRPGKESKNIFYSSCTKVMPPYKSPVIWNQLLVIHFWTKLLISAYLS